MSHWAEIDENNIVLRVLVGDNNAPEGDEGETFMNSLGGTWVKTSYNGNIRKNFAGIGYTYDEERDAFIPPKISPYAVLDEETCTWVVPQEPLKEDSVWKVVEDENGSRLVLKDEITIVQPFPSWTFSEEYDAWVAPVANPADGKLYRWDEPTLSWIEIVP